MIPGKAVVATRPIVADRPAGGRDVGGSQPFEYGWIGRPAGWGEKTRTMQAAQRDLVVSDAALAKMQHKMKADVWQMEFEERTARRQLMTEARAKVESGLRAAEVALEQRRGRLRDMLQKEDKELTAECVDRMLRADGDKLEMMRTQVAQDRARRDADARDLAEAKRVQQYRLRIDLLHNQRSRLLAQEAVKGQLCQMEERQRLRQVEREEGRFWDEVMRKEVQTKMAREEQEVREKAVRDREMREMLDKQMLGLAKQREEDQRLRQEQMRHNEQVLQQLKLEQQGLAEELEKRRSQLTAELQDQISVRQRFLEDSKRQEEIVDQTFARLTQEAIRKEKAQQLDLSASLRREQQLFRENLEEMRRRKMEEERELDRMLAEEQDKLRQRQDAMRVKAKAARHHLMEGVLSERAQQLEQRRRQRQADAEQQRVERELAEEMRRGHDALDRDHRRRRAELQRLYGHELRQQVDVAKRLREAEQAEIERQWQQGLLEEEAYLRKVQELLNVDTAEAGYPGHPFLTMLEGQASGSPPGSPGPLNQRWGPEGPPYPPGAGDQASRKGEECLCGPLAAEHELAAGDFVGEVTQQQQEAVMDGEPRPLWDPQVCHCHDS